MPEALALRHTPYVGLDLVGDWLAARGFTVGVIDAPEIDLAAYAAPIARADLLIILGGDMGVYETRAHPWIPAEIALTRARLAAARPTLGLCFGAQLMAAALGAAVFKGPATEIGWSELALTQAGAASPLAALAGRNVFHWHGDSFDLPANAALLARSELYPQAFAAGRHALGLQFHLEVSVAGLAGWLDDGHADPELAAAGLHAETLLADARRAEPATRPAAFALLDAWLARAA